MLLSLFKI